MASPCEKEWSLTDVPLDVLVLVAKALLPYDLLHLSSTCSLLRVLLYDKGLWLSIATSLSYHRPLPFTASQARALAVEHIFRTCLRTERVARKWSWSSDLHPKQGNTHIKIAFPDKRNIPYFTILPGARRIMAFDVKNALSCWATDGELLGTYQVSRGARLTRWKPIDESDSQFDTTEGAMQYTVEVMVERISIQTHISRYEVILLKYDNFRASFTRHEQFCLPSVYEPDSAMSQDELWGALVHFSGDDTERFGIYLVDRNAKKGVCIDPGVIPEYAPQALISSKYLVLYWETSLGPRSYAYRMSTLRSIIATHGLHCDGDELHENISIPVQMPPDEQYFASFNTVRRPNSNSKATNNTELSSGSNPANSEEDGLIDESIMRNNDWYPIVIPKWTTMTDDLTAHWTRSVMTLSRRPPPEGPHNPMGPGVIVNQVNALFQDFAVPNGPGGPAPNAQPGAAQGPFGLNLPQLVQMAAAQAQAFLNNNVNNPAGAANGVNANPPQQPPHDPLPQEQQAGPGQQNANPDNDINMDDNDDDEPMDDGEDGEDLEAQEMPPLLPAADEFPPPGPNDPPEPPPPPMPNNMGHFHVHHGRPPARLLTITHHYYSFTDKAPQIKRTLIAEARIRQPRHPAHTHVLGFDIFVDGPGPANVQFLPFGNGGANIPANVQVPPVGNGQANAAANGAANGAANVNPGAGPLPPGMQGLPGAFAFNVGGLPGWFNVLPQQGPAGPQVQGPQVGGFGFGPVVMGLGMAAPPAGQAGGGQPGVAGGAGAENGAGVPQGLGGAVPPPQAANLPAPPAFPLPAGLPQNDDIGVEELSGGTPVMGYGGRCALWVQEGEGATQGAAAASREGIVKIATFPSHALQDIPVERHASLLDSYTSLERAGGNLCTVHVPECVDVENALAFDLDDVRGVVGISNNKGEIWLVDYS